MHGGINGSYMSRSTWQQDTPPDRIKKHSGCHTCCFQLELELQGQERNGVFETFWINIQDA